MRERSPKDLSGTALGGRNCVQGTVAHSCPANGTEFWSSLEGDLSVALEYEYIQNKAYCRN